MIEMNNMLHLRKYTLIVLRSNTTSRVACLFHSKSSSASRGGYVLRSLNHCYTQRVNSRPNYTVCNIRTFSTTLQQSSVDEVNEKLTSFCNDVKHGQTWSVDKLNEVIHLCDESNYQLQPSTGMLLLKCCVDPQSIVKSSERQNLANQIWQLTKRNDGALTLEHYNTLLNVHAENCSSVDPEKFLDDMNVQPDDDTYRLLFNIAVKTGNTTHVQNIMPMILERKISLDEDAFRTLVQIHLAKNNIPKALDVIALARDIELPVNKLYNELACKYAAQGDMSNLTKILNDEPQSDTSLLKIIKALSISGNGSHIRDIMNFFTNSICTIESEMNNLITELVYADRVMDAYTIINYIILNVEDTKHTANFISNFLNQLIMVNAPVKDIVIFAGDFVESGHEPMALHNIAETSLKLVREELSLAVFAAMREKDIEVRTHYYWPLLLNAQRNEGEVKIYSLVKTMGDMDIKLDVNTLVDYVLPYVNTTNSIMTMRRLKMCGISQYSLSTPLVLFLLNRHRLNDVIGLFEYSKHILDYRIFLRSLVQVYFATRDVENCARVLTTFKSGLNYISSFLGKILRTNSPKIHIEEFQTMLKTFDRHKVIFSSQENSFLKKQINNINVSTKMSTELYKIIDQMTKKNIQLPIITTIPHPKYMTTNELACHLVELKNSQEIIGTRNILQHLMKAYYLENNLKKAEEVKEEFNRQQYPWTSGMKMYLFTLYVLHDKLEEAETLLTNIAVTNNMFSLDSEKILLFAIALVKAGRPSKAFNIIMNISNINNREYMENRSCQLLNMLVENEHYKSTKDMLHLLIKKNYCQITNKTLQPLIAVHLNQNNILLAVEKLAQYMQLYQYLPLVLEVITALLREKDSRNMQNVDKHIKEVYDMIVTQQGIDVANTVIILGLANLNKMEELQTILKNQRIFIDVLMYYFNNEQRSHDVNALLRILEASHSSDMYQSSLCDKLLMLYSKTSDHKSGLTLWELMCAKNIQPSNHFKQHFSEFLLMNKVPLPANFISDISEVNAITC